MELLAAILVATWLVGIAYTTTQSVLFYKRGEGELADTFRDIAAQNPPLVFGLLTVLIVAWPATLAYSLVQKRK